MKRYLAERFDKIAGSLTADDCHQVIAAATEDIETADKYKDIIAACEAARYASADAPTSVFPVAPHSCFRKKAWGRRWGRRQKGVGVDAGQIKEVIELIRIIDRKSKK